VAAKPLITPQKEGLSHPVMHEATIERRGKTAESLPVGYADRTVYSLMHTEIVMGEYTP